ncbi:MAG: ABC transporter permease, partial [Calditrichaeota bacterium]
MKRYSGRLLAIARKEFFHIIHDPRTLMIVIIMPIIQLLMFGYALNLEIQNVDMAVVDFDRSPASRQLIRQFQGSRFFTVYSYQGSMEEIDKLFLTRSARVVMIIPENFSKKFTRNPSTSVQFIIDGADPNAAINIKNYCEQAVLKYNLQENQFLTQPFEIEPTIWFNPDLKSTYFFVPGILALILVMISA